MNRFFFFFSSRRRHTRSLRDWSSDVCSSDLRAQPAVAPVMTSGDVCVDPARHSARRGENELDLGPKEFGVLELLLASQGRVVSAEELLERVWDEMADPFSSAV